MKLSLKIVVNWKYFPQPTSVNYALHQDEDISVCYKILYSGLWAQM